ncbi:uncharacterized protein [Palaemon carinicauda]|uniref:uncharacterized protein n=1 Tax=Palaemon carinicauda TaxID=392227 RepID=UPI0035B5BE1A
MRALYTWITAFTILTTTLYLPLYDAQQDANFTSIPITYVEGRRPADDLIMASDLSIPAHESYHSFQTDKFCTCRSACWASYQCRASSLQQVDRVSFCRLSSTPVRQTPLQKTPNAIYIIKTERIEHYFYGIGDDGLLYLAPKPPLPQSDVLNSCQKIPGHRLAKPKTDTQKMAMLKISRDIMNGTRMRVYDMNDNLVMMKDGEIMASTDSTVTEPTPFLCQANPHNLNW